MTQVDRLRISSVLPADTDFEARAGGPTLVHSQLHESSDTQLVDRGKRILGQDALAEIIDQEP